ncbi:MAG: 50S ribosomal protein L28 [Bdellovibrionota bacterium]|nr:50S ribosomal protein L28 [Deltaproteobacteria bacterium]
MAQICELTGKKPLTGNKVSNSNVKTKMRQMPNLHTKRFFIPELKKSVSLKLSSHAIRTIDKIGLTKAVLKQDEALLSKTLQKVQRDLRK